jgi:hypothetical protein
MSAEAPILQKIHKSKATASWEPWYSEEHGARISCIGINSNSEGYKITTYAGGWGYDGYNISAKAKGGIFGTEGPSKIETGRDYSGLMFLSFGEPQTTETGHLEVPATASTPSRQENLLLPGDKGFELFAELHRQAQGLRPVITDAVDLIQPGIQPYTLVYEYKGDQSVRFDHDKQIASVTGSALIEVNDTSGSGVKVELDATQDYPFEAPASLPRFKANDDTVYRSGTATVEHEGEEEIRALDFYTLIAFSAVQNAIEKLYKAEIKKQ